MNIPYDDNAEAHGAMRRPQTDGQQSMTVLEGSTEPTPSQAVAGFLETVSEEGWVLGWAWYPDLPEARVEIEILIDGTLTGTTLAATFRQDVATAGYGNGHYGFSWPLPYAVLAQPRDVTITARDKRSGMVLPKPWVFRQKRVADAVQKITELENDVRLLNGTIAELSRRNAQDDRGTAELFKTVGDFFAELAALNAAGAPPRQLRSLKTAVSDVTANFVPFAFRPCAAPDITIVCEAAGPAATVYASLRALSETIGEAPAEVFLLDEGACDEAPLLPLVVQNIRYARMMGETAVARRNDAMRLANGKFVVFLAAGVEPATFWIDALAAFELQAGLAALAARVTGPDGRLANAGINVRDGEIWLRGQGEDPRDDDFMRSAAVDAVGAEFFALRRVAWARLSGFDEGFSNLAPALVEFCLRAKAAGETVGYAPGFHARFAGALEGCDLGALGADAQRLREVIEHVGPA